VKPVVLAARANRDLAEIMAFISENAPEAAMRVERRLRERATGIAQFPSMGALRPDGLSRLLPVAATPYSLIYREEPERITILHIWHGARGWPPVS